MPATRSHSTPEIRRVAISSFLGTTIEYYDFLLYGIAAAMVFNQVFFSNLSPAIGTIVALGTLAAGYAARVVGALVFGHLGDRIGRKKVIITTLTVMGITSGVIGLLPTYDQIGVAAPLLLVLLRVIQGVVVGGEYGGAVLMTSEHAGAGNRGLTSSAAPMGAGTGSVLATGAMLVVATMPEASLFAWGWRIPFLASFVLLAVALYYRTRILESPVFLAEKDTEVHTSAPLVELLRSHPWTLVKSIVVQWGPYTGQGVFGIYIVSYAPTIGYSRSSALIAVMVGTLGSVFLAPFYAHLSDRIGRRRFFVIGVLATLVSAFPLFTLINMGSTTVFVASVTLYLMVVMPMISGVAPVYLTELFDTGSRYTGVSVSYQLAVTLGSGFGPLIAAALLAAAGGGTNTWMISIFMLIVSVLSLISALSLRETMGSQLTRAIEPVRTPDAVESK